jgi:hypothetical protein
LAPGERVNAGCPEAWARAAGRSPAGGAAGAGRGAGRGAGPRRRNRRARSSSSIRSRSRSGRGSASDGAASNRGGSNSRRRTTAHTGRPAYSGGGSASAGVLDSGERAGGGTARHRPWGGRSPAARPATLTAAGQAFGAGEGGPGSGPRASNSPPTVCARRADKQQGGAEEKRIDAARTGSGTAGTAAGEDVGPISGEGWAQRLLFHRGRRRPRSEFAHNDSSQR